MFGLAIYLYQGADTPTDSIDDQQNDQQSSAPKPVAPPQSADPYTEIKAAIGATNPTTELLELWFSHQATVESNPEIKAMFTQKKQELSNKQ
jgi:hypothetical protein